MVVPFPGQAVKVRKLNRKWAEVRLPKIGAVRFRLSCPLGGAVRNATVRRDGLGWHVSFGVATDTEPAAPNGLPGCGVDFGVACSAYVSDETGPRRLDFTHKLTTDLAKSHGWVGIEDLRVKNMTHSAKGTALAPGRGVTAKAGLNRGILDNTPYERRRQLAYKARRFGSELRVVPAHGTSQTCSACGARDPGNRPGCGRVFADPTCGHQAHADHNASAVIGPVPAGLAARSPTARAVTLGWRGPQGAACVNPSGTRRMSVLRESLPFRRGGSHSSQRRGDMRREPLRSLASARSMDSHSSWIWRCTAWSSSGSHQSSSMVRTRSCR